MIPAPGRHYSWDLASELAFDRSACTEYLVLSNSYVGQFPNRPFCLACVRAAQQKLLPSGGLVCLYVSVKCEM